MTQRNRLKLTYLNMCILLSVTCCCDYILVHVQARDYNKHNALCDKKT